MSSNRVTYDTLGIFKGPMFNSGNYGTGDFKQIHRVQSSNINIEARRNQLLSLGDLEDREPFLESPFITLDFEHLVTDGKNENSLGLFTDGVHGALFNIREATNDYFILINDKFGTQRTLGVGNATLVGYSVRGSVGDVLKGTVNLEGFNITAVEGNSGENPSIDSAGNPLNFNYELPLQHNYLNERERGLIAATKAIRPSEIELRIPNDIAFGTFVSGLESSHPQSFNLNINLPRNEIRKLGERYPFHRPLSYPIEITFSADYIIKNFEETKSIREITCDAKHNLFLDVYECLGVDADWNISKNLKLQYALKGMRFEGASINQGVGENSTISFNWKGRFGNLLDSEKNFLISGNFGEQRFEADQWFAVNGTTGVSGLEPFVQKIVFNRFLSDSTVPDFSVQFTGDQNISEDDINNFTNYYVGDSGIRFKSGKFGLEVAPQYEKWNVPTLPPSYDGFSGDIGVRKNWSGLQAVYVQGYPSNFDVPESFRNYFYIKSEGLNDGIVNLELTEFTPGFSGTLKENVIKLDSAKPYYYNYIEAFSIDGENNPRTPFKTQLNVTCGDFKRKYDIFGQTFNFSPSSGYSNIVLPQEYSSLTVLWLDVNDWKNTANGINFEPDIVTFKNISDKSFKKNHYTNNSQNFTNLAYIVTSGETGTNGGLLKSGRRPFIQKNISDEFTKISGFVGSGDKILEEDYNNFTIFFMGKVEGVKRPLATGDDTMPNIFTLSNDIFDKQGIRFDVVEYNSGILTPSFRMSYVIEGVSGVTGLPPESEFRIGERIDLSGDHVPSYKDWFLSSFRYDGNILEIKIDGERVYFDQYKNATGGKFEYETGVYWPEFPKKNYSHIFHDISGQFAEFIVMPFALNTGEIAEIEESYFKYKYGFNAEVPSGWGHSTP